MLEGLRAAVRKYAPALALVKTLGCDTDAIEEVPFDQHVEEFDGEADGLLGGFELAVQRVLAGKCEVFVDLKDQGEAGVIANILVDDGHTFECSDGVDVTSCEEGQSLALAWGLGGNFVAQKDFPHTHLAVGPDFIEVDEQASGKPDDPKNRISKMHVTGGKCVISLIEGGEQVVGTESGRVEDVQACAGIIDQVAGRVRDFIDNVELIRKVAEFKGD